MGRLFLNTRPHVPAATDPNDDRRPSHWQEDQNEREIPPNLEYPTAVMVEPHFGFSPPQDPVPVYQVQPPPGDRAVRNWAPGSGTATTVAMEINGSDRRRKKLVIRNVGDTNIVYLIREQGDITILGYPLEPNAEVELTHNDQVWARTATSTSDIGWYAEYELEEV